MDRIQDLQIQLESPPPSSTFSMNCKIPYALEIIIIIYIGFEACINLLHIFRYGSFSFIDLLKIIVDGLLFVGACLIIYGLIIEDTGKAKNGFCIFLLGLIGVIIIMFLDIFKSGFGVVVFIKLLLYGLFAYIIFIQSRHF